MITPNRSIAGKWALHEYKDHVVDLCRLNERTGEWYRDHEATDADIAWFEKHGAIQRVAPKLRTSHVENAEESNEQLPAND